MKIFIVVGLLAMGTLAWAEEACVDLQLENNRLKKALAEYQVTNGVAVARQSNTEIQRLEKIVAERQSANATPAPPPPPVDEVVGGSSSMDAK